MATVRAADQILVMEEGRIIARGAHAELLESSPLYREMVLSQSASEVSYE